MNASAGLPESVARRRARTFQRLFLDHVWGPFGSLLLHVGLVLLIAHLFHLRTREPAPEISYTLSEAPPELPLEPPPPLPLPPELAPPPVELPQVASVPSPEPPVPETSPDVFSPVVAQVEVPTVPTIPVVNDPFPWRIGSPTDAPWRPQVPEDVPATIARALDWLQSTQLPNGAWPQDVPGSAHTGITGLAVLTFLAHGETPSSRRYGDTVERALRHLLSVQRPDGVFTQGDGHAYSHAIATYALAEAYAMTRIPALRDALERGVSVIVRGQQAAGGWDYNYAKGSRRDTSFVAWQVQALKAARLAGCQAPGLAEAMRRATEDLRMAYVPASRRFAYTDGGGTAATSGGAVLGLQMLGQGGSREIRSALDPLRSLAVSWDDEATPNAPYAYYYITQACFHEGGATWAAWNRKFSRPIMDAQKPDGHWDVPPGRHNPGNVLNTTLAALTLQVYYRHLPTFQEQAVGKAPGADESPSPDDLRIQLSI